MTAERIQVRYDSLFVGVLIDGRRLTFKLDTRSAVSKRVNWLIWSTIPTILGFAAASVELCRRVMRKELATRALVEARSCRAQHCAAYRLDNAMFSRICGEEEEGFARWPSDRFCQFRASWRSGDFLASESPELEAASDWPGLS